MLGMDNFRQWMCDCTTTVASLTLGIGLTTTVVAADLPPDETYTIHGLYIFEAHATDLNDRLPRGCFDLVVSFFALHHVREKSRLIKEVSSRLVEGGRFLWADITTAETSALEQLFLDDWVGFMRGAGLNDEEISHVLQDHRENDLAETVESLLRYMRRAALDPAAVVWSQGKFVLLFGRRSP